MAATRVYVSRGVLLEPLPLGDFPRSTDRPDPGYFLSFFFFFFFIVKTFIFGISQLDSV